MTRLRSRHAARLAARSVARCRVAERGVFQGAKFDVVQAAQGWLEQLCEDCLRVTGELAGGGLGQVVIENRQAFGNQPLVHLAVRQRLSQRGGRVRVVAVSQVDADYLQRQRMSPQPLDDVARGQPLGIAFQ